jgi:hypothetical protein
LGWNTSAAKGELPVGVSSSLVRWCETSHSDFADGIVDPQMYVSRRAQLELDSGCVEFFARFDVNNDGYYDLVSSSFNGPNLRLWLGDSVRYGLHRVINYAISSGGSADLADLNMDGYAELVHSGFQSHCSVFWGSASGPLPDSETQLPNGNAEDVYVYDLDKDGFLDIVLGGDYGSMYIYWGSPQGYSVANRTVVPLGNSLVFNIEIADFDKDGWGDIAFEQYGSDNPIIYWGPGRTYRSIVRLPNCGGSPHGISVADLDKNGWLDLVYTTGGSGTRACVYWGSPTGFSSVSRTWLQPGNCYGGSSIADFDGDGWLDILFWVFWFSSG